MKLLKLMTLLFLFSIFNTTSHAFEEDCNSIKQNIVKKLACKAMSGSGGSSQNVTSSKDEITITAEEKTGIFSKIWKKPNWMKKKN